MQYTNSLLCGSLSKVTVTLWKTKITTDLTHESSTTLLKAEQRIRDSFILKSK